MAQGDLIKLTLDCDAGTLSIARNGNELGVAFDFLPKGEALFPAVSFNTNGDKMTILQNTPSNASVVAAKKSAAESKKESSSSSSSSASSASAAAIEADIQDWMAKTMTRMSWCAQFMRSLSQRTPLPLSVALPVYAHAVQFAARGTRKLELSDGSSVQVDLAPSSLAALGVTLGQRVSSKKGRGVVLGVEVAGRKRRKEIATELTNRCSIGLEEEEKRVAEAKTAAAAAAAAQAEASKKGPAPVDQTSSCIHPASLVEENKPVESSSSAFDAASLHPCSLPTPEPTAAAKPSSSVLSFSFGRQTTLSTPSKGSTSSSSSSSSGGFSLTFSAPREPTLWLRIDGTDDPVAVHKKDLDFSVPSVPEEKQAEAKEEEEEKKQSDSAPAKAEDAPAAATSSSPSSASVSSSPSSSSSSSVSVSTSLPSPWPLSSFLSSLNNPRLNSHQVDAQMVRLINNLADAIGCHPFTLLLQDLREALPLNPQVYPALAQLSLEHLVVRFALLRTFNAQVSPILMDLERPSTGFGGAAAASSPASALAFSVGGQLSVHRALLFTRVKLRHWHTLVSSTATYTKPSDDPYELSPGIKTITLNRHRAAKAREKGSLESRLLYTMVGQAKRELGHWAPSELRRHYTKIDDGGQFRTFVVNFAAEGARDNGGVYTELFSSMMEELQSDSLPFFIRTPNARAAVGGQQDSWMPSPSCTSHTSLEYLRFIGQMLGVALRGNIQLNFNVHPLFWKTLAGVKIGLADFEETDLNFTQLVAKMKTEAVRMRKDLVAAGPDADTSAADEFGSLFGVETFTCLLSDGLTSVELGKDGASRPVTLANVDEWIERAVEARLHETDLQIGALRSGLASIVPLHLSCFLSWFELQRLFCGLPDFTVAQLQSVTKYEGGMNESVPHIRWFWQVLGEMTPAQRAQFMRFVFARDRLPARPGDLGIKFKLQDPLANTAAKPDAHFPSTHTCFFSLSLPKYSSLAVLKEKLLYAIYACASLDGDLALKNSELYDYTADDIAAPTDGGGAGSKLF
jgi:hypothetical protein